MKIKYLFVILLIIGTVFSSVMAKEFAPVGTAAAQFLEIAQDARGTGMGQAYTALVFDASSVFWNPAGIVGVNGKGIFLGYNQWVADINFGSFSFAWNFGSAGAIAISGVYLFTPDMDVTTVMQPEGTGETFSLNNHSFGLTYARKLTDKLAFGITLKSVREYYYSYGYTTWAFDVGTVYHTGFRGLKIGMSIQHFGPEVRYNSSYIDYSNPRSYVDGNPVRFDKFSLPVNFRVGFGMNVLQKENQKLLVAGDMVHSNNNLEFYNLGLEYAFKNRFFLRGGYRINLDEGGLTLGLGVKFPWLDGKNGAIDYSFADRGIFNGIHRFSIGFDL
ncbi:PorV/PorQ family protein [Calditrichota bacterium LG25]